MRRLDIHRHLTKVVLDVWVLGLVLRHDIIHRVIESRFSRSQKRGRIVWYEAGLPAFLKVLARIADQVALGNEGAAKVHQVTDCCPHPDWIPPRSVYFHRWIGEIAGH